MSVAALLWTADAARAGSARDYLNAPVDSWFLSYNAGYTTSVTPEDGTDTVPGVRANVSAICAHRHQRWPVPSQHQWRFRRRLSLADEHFWRTGADARAVPVLRATDVLELSSPADAYYNLGGETSIDGIDQDNMANTLRIGAGMGHRLWRGADMALNY